MRCDEQNNSNLVKFNLRMFVYKKENDSIKGWHYFNPESKSVYVGYRIVYGAPYTVEIQMEHPTFNRHIDIKAENIKLMLINNEDSNNLPIKIENVYFIPDTSNKKILARMKISCDSSETGSESQIMRKAHLSIEIKIPGGHIYSLESKSIDIITRRNAFRKDLCLEDIKMESDVTLIPGVGPTLASKLKSDLNIKNVGDFKNYIERIGPDTLVAKIRKDRSSFTLDFINQIYIFLERCLSKEFEPEEFGLEQIRNESAPHPTQIEHVELTNADQFRESTLQPETLGSVIASSPLNESIDMSTEAGENEKGSTQEQQIESLQTSSLSDDNIPQPSNPVCASDSFQTSPTADESSPHANHSEYQDMIDQIIQEAPSFLQPDPDLPQTDEAVYQKQATLLELQTITPPVIQLFKVTRRSHPHHEPAVKGFHYLPRGEEAQRLQYLMLLNIEYKIDISIHHPEFMTRMESGQANLNVGFFNTENIANKKISISTISHNTGQDTSQAIINHSVRIKLNAVMTELERADKVGYIGIQINMPSGHVYLFNTDIIELVFKEKFSRDTCLEFIKPNSPVKNIPFVGPEIEKRLNELQITNVREFIDYVKKNKAQTLYNQVSHAKSIFTTDRINTITELLEKCINKGFTPEPFRLYAATVYAPTTMQSLHAEPHPLPLEEVPELEYDPVIYEEKPKFELKVSQHGRVLKGLHYLGRKDKSTTVKFIMTTGIYFYIEIKIQHPRFETPFPEEEVNLWVKFVNSKNPINDKIQIVQHDRNVIQDISQKTIAVKAKVKFLKKKGKLERSDKFGYFNINLKMPDWDFYYFNTDKIELVRDCAYYQNRCIENITMNSHVSEIPLIADVRAKNLSDHGITYVSDFLAYASIHGNAELANILSMSLSQMNVIIESLNQCFVGGFTPTPFCLYPTADTAQKLSEQYAIIEPSLVPTEQLMEDEYENVPGEAIEHSYRLFSLPPRKRKGPETETELAWHMSSADNPTGDSLLTESAIDASESAIDERSPKFHCASSFWDKNKVEEEDGMRYLVDDNEEQSPSKHTPIWQK